MSDTVLQPTLTLFMENLLPIGQVRDPNTRRELLEEVEEECTATGYAHHLLLCQAHAFFMSSIPSVVSNFTVSLLVADTVHTLVYKLG